MKFKRRLSLILTGSPDPDSKEKKEKPEYRRAISASSPPLPPREHLAVLDALGCVRSQLQQTEQADTALCRSIESSGSALSIDHDLLLLKATSAASLHCLNQCLSVLQRNQHAQQSRTGFVVDDD